MGKPWSVIGKVIRDYWDEMFNLMLCNMLWLLAQVLIIPGPPATAALFYVTNRVAHGQFARLPEFREGFKRFFWSSWKWGGLNLLVILIFVYASVFYGLGDFPQPYGFMLMWVNMLLLVGWLFTQLFAFPFWLQQSDKRIGLALRNAMIIQGQNVGLTLMAFALAVVVIVLTVVFPVLVGMLTIAFLTLLGNTIVVAQIKALEGDGESEDF